MDYGSEIRDKNWILPVSKLITSFVPIFNMHQSSILSTLDIIIATPLYHGVYVHVKCETQILKYNLTYEQDDRLLMYRGIMLVLVQIDVLGGTTYYIAGNFRTVQNFTISRIGCMQRKYPTTVYYVLPRKKSNV